MFRRSVYADENWIGKEFGKRVVISIGGVKNGYLLWNVKCFCGDISEVPATSIVRGRALMCVSCANKEQSGAKHPMWRGSRHMPLTLLNKWRKSASLRNIDWALSSAYLDDLIDAQGWRCKFTGRALSLDFGQKNGVENGNASLDRIDSSKGYIEGNVQFVLKIVNMAKQNLSDDDFIEHCKAVAKHSS